MQPYKRRWQKENWKYFPDFWIWDLFVGEGRYIIKKKKESKRGVKEHWFLLVFIPNQTKVGGKVFIQKLFHGKYQKYHFQKENQKAIMGMENSVMLCAIPVNHTSSRRVSGQPGCQQVACETEQELISCTAYRVGARLGLVPCCGHRQAAGEAGGRAHQSKRSQRQGFCSRGNCRREKLLVKPVVGCTAFIRAMMTVLQRRPFLSVRQWVLQNQNSLLAPITQTHWLTGQP